MRKILIVEDEPITSMFVERSLEKSGFEVCGTTARGEAVLMLVKKFNPDLILLDVKLKGEVTGIDVCRQMRGENINTPIIITTGNSDPHTLAELKPITNIQFLFKPYNQEELIGKINEVLGL